MSKRMNHIVMALGTLLAFGNVIGQSQTQLSNPNFETQVKNTTPVSPNAASLGKYGNIPVNLSTGMTNIDLPIYQMSARGMNINVSLSYNSGGNKVENIASWVGLGWNLNVGGVISRSVNGIADDALNGYMTNQPRSVDFIIENLSNPTYATEIKNYLKMAGAGTYDLEPDMYMFNFMGHSGKFYFDQKNRKFNMLPLQNHKVEYTNDGNFIITTDDGFKYYFEAKETTTTSGSICVSTFTSSNPGNPTTTISSWFLTRIENATNTESVNLQYDDYVSNNETNFSRTKYVLKSSSGTWAPGTNPPDYSQRTCNNSIIINGKRLKNITTSTGRIQFTPYEFGRCDVQGEQSLKRIDVFDNNAQLIKSVEFNYGYFGGPDDISNCQYSLNTRNYYLKLKSISEVNTDANPVKLTTQFEYSETPVPYAGRFSYAQDFWGYYNGAESNTDLIPPAFMTNPYVPDWSIYVPGANRKPDVNFSQFGILKKIKYPTGGYTEFVYENNSAADIPLAPEFITRSVMLEGDHVGSTTYYEKEFEINYPSNYYNGFNQNGGAFVSMDFGEIGCTYVNNQASTCAVLAVTGLTPGTVGFTVTSNIQSRYLPNGRYKISAQFSQYPPQFADFFFRVLWKEPLIEENRLAGGLRIKNISDYDGITTTPYNVQNFFYNKPGSTKSSGKLINIPNTYTTDFKDIFYSMYCEGSSCTDYEYERNFLKIGSTTNSPLILSNGSYVMYENVRVEYHDISKVGNKDVKHKFVPDIISTQFPYVQISNEWMRGALVNENINKWENGALTKIESTDLILKSVDINPTVSNYSVRALKPYFTSTSNYGTNSPQHATPPVISQRIYESTIPNVEEYAIISGLEKKDVVTKSFSAKDASGNPITLYVSEQYDYNRSQVSSVRTTNSKGEDFLTSYKYPYDYPSEPVYQQMVNRNNISPVIEEIKKKTSINKELERTKTNYALTNANSFILPSTVQVSRSGNLLETSLTINKYDSKGNILQYTTKDGLVTCFIWGYGQYYPVAKIVGVEHATIAPLFSQAILDASSSTEQQIRDELNKIRVGLANTKALINTYTYKPLIGITSETDPNGKITYYEYDSFGRLKRMLDEQRNVIKIMDYQYQAPIGN